MYEDRHGQTARAIVISTSSAETESLSFEIEALARSPRLRCGVNLAVVVAQRDSDHFAFDHAAMVDGSLSFIETAISAHRRRSAKHRQHPENLRANRLAEDGRVSVRPARRCAAVRAEAAARSPATGTTAASFVAFLRSLVTSGAAASGPERDTRSINAMCA
jgi:hypothetical protein